MLNIGTGQNAETTGLAISARRRRYLSTRNGGAHFKAPDLSCKTHVPHIIHPVRFLKFRITKAEVLDRLLSSRLQKYWVIQEVGRPYHAGTQTENVMECETESF